MRMERYQGTGRRDGGRDGKRRESGERERVRERGMNVQRGARETEVVMCLCGGA